MSKYYNLHLSLDKIVNLWYYLFAFKGKIQTINYYKIGESKMKNNYYLRFVDEAGRIVIPKELRKLLGIIPNETNLELFLDSDKIVMKKHSPGCLFCGNVDDIFEFKGQKICTDCLEKLNKIKEISE